MGLFDQRVLSALKDGEPQSFTALKNQAGFSHNTLQQHPTGLIEKGLILKEKGPAKSFGRPKYLYLVHSRNAKQVAAALDDSDVELLTLPFSRVKHVCRFEKGGWCKMRKRPCSPQIYLQIRK